jgi:AcrR family transcriptional regulator
MTTEKRMTKGQRTAQRIMDAAEKLFAENGYEGTSLREIAEAVDIQEPGLYRHFENKQALYRAVLERALQPLLDVMTEMHEKNAGLEDLARLPAIVLELFNEHPYMGVLFQRAVMAPDDKHTAMNDWLESLVMKGRDIMNRAPIENMTDEDVAIRLVNFFNLCTGHFASASILRVLINKEATEEEILEKQKNLVNNMLAAMMVS